MMLGELASLVPASVPAIESVSSLAPAAGAVPVVSQATGPAGPSFLRTAVVGALFLVAGLCLPCAYRVVAGPTIPDRVVGIDAIATNVVSIAVLVALLTDRGLFVTIALVLAIIAFVTTVTVAKFVVEGDIIE